MVIFDILVIVRLRKSKMNIGGARNSRSSRFTINTILIDLIYLIFNFPYTFCSIFFLINNSYSVESFAFLRIVVFINDVFKFLPLIYSSFLFFIFVIFNRNFRFELFSIGVISKLKNLFKSNNNSTH